MAGIELEIREASGQDAQSVIELIERLSQETDFITLSESFFSPSVTALSVALNEKQYQANSICLLVYANEDLIALCHVASDHNVATNHVGDLFIGVKKAYWGHGIGSWLLDEVVSWAEESSVIRRLELTVQTRNEVAVHLYKKFGFSIEGIKARGAKTENGEFLDLYYMGKMID